ncbi:sensor domain-containing diguanylate cyclase [Salinicola rhizosphaerae]|uniref:Diguanylate cyclase n=1 Tax=Salinicola rhizosphaerae TaxID=1443141 RepID=A0ABQ3DXX1_9GAMM|nr:sensor domain-containing diguanylate cyclase [Salinicola rhizosphaerae]GHB17485.1 hypothetical protein GCM10009038_15340 [Salinicola rhizosphaerae]
MCRLLNLFRTRLALRATAAILLIVVILGVIFLALGIYLRTLSVEREQSDRIQELLTTVERTAQVGCFLGDAKLTQEVVDGLLSNDIVSSVTVRVGSGAVLASGSSGSGGPASTAISRVIYSPFDAEDAVCNIKLLPDQQQIDALVNKASLFIALALALQLTGIGICVVLVVVRFVTRPITSISHRLSELEAETGQKLKAPRGNRGDEIGQLVVSVNAMIDNLVQSLGEERRLRLEREIEERRYRAIFDTVDAGLFELDDGGRIRVANPAFRRLFDIPLSHDLTREPLLLASCISEGAPEPSELFEAKAGGRDERQWEVGIGDEALRRWVNLSLSPLGVGRLQGVAQDITARKEASDAAERMAVTDPLTGLGNRRGFERRLAVMSRHHRLYPERRHALLMLDFDHFKQINDTYGHHAGDRVLRRVGGILANLIRQRDYVARLGGDEFVVLLEGCADRDDVERLLMRFMEQLQTPVRMRDGEEVTVGASVGIAMLGLDTDDPQQALQYADMAMYAAKRAGRSTWRFHESGRVADPS